MYTKRSDYQDDCFVNRKTLHFCRVFMMRLWGFLLFSSKEESCYTEDTKYDQNHSTNHVAKNIETQNQKNDTKDSEHFFFSGRYFSSSSDFASKFFSFSFDNSCFFFEIFCKCFCFDLYWFSYWRSSSGFFSWHYAYM